MDRFSENNNEEWVEIDIREYIGIFWKKKWLIIGLIIFALILGYIYSLRSDKVYRTSTIVLVEEESSAENLFAEGFSMMRGQTQKLETYRMMFTTGRILREVIDNLDLKTEEGKPLSASYLNNKIQVTGNDNTNLLTITVSYNDPVKARDIADEIVDVFIRENLDLKRADLEGASGFIENQLVETKRELSHMEEELLNHRREQEVIRPEEQAEHLLEELLRLETNYAQTRIQIEESKAGLEEINRRLEEEDENIVSTRTFTENPQLQELEGRLSNLEIELAGLKENYTSSHPEVRQVISEIEETKERIKEKTSEIVSSRTEGTNPLYQNLRERLVELRTQITTGQVKMRGYEEQIDSLNKEIKVIPEKELELVRLERERDITEQIFLLLRERKEEIQIQESMQSPDIVVVDPPMVEREPIKPRTNLNLIIAAFLASVIGFGLVLIMEYLDTTVSEEEEIEKLTGLPVLGVIPNVDNVKKDMKGVKDNE